MVVRGQTLMNGFFLPYLWRVPNNRKSDSLDYKMAAYLYLLIKYTIYHVYCDRNCHPVSLLLGGQSQSATLYIFCIFWLAHNKIWKNWNKLNWVINSLNNKHIFINWNVYLGLPVAVNFQHKWKSIVKVILVLEIAGTIILPVDDQLISNSSQTAQLPNHNNFNQLCSCPSEQKTERYQLATINFITNIFF